MLDSYERLSIPKGVAARRLRTTDLAHPGKTREAGQSSVAATWVEDSGVLDSTSNTKVG